MEGAPAIEVLRCAACGGAVPLAGRSATTCPFCRAPVPIPEAHRALHTERAALRDACAQAEQAWRRLPRPLPAWCTDQGHWLILLAVVALAIANGFGASRWGWYQDAQAGFTFAFVTPLAVMLIGYLDVLASQMYARESRALVAPVDDAGWPACRACGAPLAREPNAMSATCSYCGADSVIVRLGRASRTRFDAAQAAAAGSLADAVRSLESKLAERRLVRIISTSVIGPIWLGFLLYWLL